MTVTCEIEFDKNPNGTYFAGQVVNGKIILQANKTKLVKGIAFNIDGYAETHWTRTRTNNDKNETRHYHGREDYIATQTFLVGSNANTVQIPIEPGIHVYNFSCQIPVVCPSSFEGTHGRVRYTVNVSLMRPWKFDHTFKRSFTVLKLMDLNYDSPMLRMPVQMETLKTYCCWPCTSAPLGLQLTLPQGGFVPGQNIPVGVLVSNESHIRVEEVTVRLAMLVCYYSQPPRVASKNERYVLTKFKGDAVLSHCKKQFNYMLPVPATPPTCFNLCRIIQIAYSVEVEAKVKGCHSNATVNVPVTIGSVPLVSHTAQPQLQQPRGPLEPQPLDAQQLVPASAPSDSPWAIDDTIPPPNYQEALHMRSVDTSKGAGDKANEQAPPNTLNLGESAFTPLYPVFNIPSPTAPPSDWERAAGVGNVNVETDMNKGTWI